MPVKCVACHRKFEPKRIDAKVCSAACRQMAYRRRLGVTARRNVQPRRRGNVHWFSSDTNMWTTPQDLYDKLDAEFHFSVDVCATAENTKCEAFYSPADDGLAQQWSGTCWMNPPYGRDIGKWMAKAKDAAQAGATVVCLVPVRTDTRWLQDNVTKAQDVRFLPGRLKFGNAQSSAPFPSAIVVFKAA
jgi:phage N-6-adenine-methyltransferase